MKPLSANTRRRCCVAVLAITAAAHAGSTEVELHAGSAGGRYDVAGASFRLAPAWIKTTEAWNASLAPQIDLVNIHYSGSHAGADSTTGLGAVAMARLERASGTWRPYGEAGLGASLFNRTEVGDKQISTAFQFSEHLGVGLRRAGSWSAGYRFTHYSNADIKRPNDSLNLHQLVVGIEF